MGGIKEEKAATMLSMLINTPVHHSFILNSLNVGWEKKGRNEMRCLPTRSDRFRRRGKIARPAVAFDPTGGGRRGERRVRE